MSIPDARGLRLRCAAAAVAGAMSFGVVSAPAWAEGRPLAGLLFFGGGIASLFVLAYRVGRPGEDINLLRVVPAPLGVTTFVLIFLFMIDDELPRGLPFFHPEKVGCTLFGKEWTYLLLYILLLVAAVCYRIVLLNLFKSFPRRPEPGLLD